MATNLKNSAFKVKVGKAADVSKSLPEVGAIVVNELDDFLYIATRYGWGRGTDASQKQINLFLDYDGVTQFSLIWKMPSTSSIVIDFGDGAGPQTLPGQDGTMITTPSTYTTQGQYYITIGGDIEDFTWFRLLFQPNLYGDVTRCENMSNLEIFTLNDVSVTCDLTGFDMATLANFAIQDSPNVFGDISGIKVTGPLTLRNVGNLSLKSDPDWSALVLLNCNDSNFTREETDRAIRGLKNASGCESSLDGNELPSEAVKADLLTGLANGNQYIFGGRLPFFDLGPELYVDNNAVAIGSNEANATAPWSANGLGSPNEFEVTSGVNDVRKSNFGFHANGNPNPTSGWDINTTIPTTSGNLTVISFNIRHSGIGGHTSYRMWGLSNMGWALYPVMNTWRHIHTYVEARANNTTLEMGEFNTGNNGEFFLDNLSVREIV